jgi:hypothetical protein
MKQLTKDQHDEIKTWILSAVLDEDFSNVGERFTCESDFDELAARMDFNTAIEKQIDQ